MATKIPTFTVYKNNTTSNDQENIYATVNEVDLSDSDSKTFDSYYTTMKARATLPQEKFELFENPIYDNSTLIPQSQEVPSSSIKTRKVYIIIFSIIVAVSLMLSATALLYSVLHKEKADLTEGEIGGTSQQTSQNNNTVSDLVHRLNSLESLLRQMQVNLGSYTHQNFSTIGAQLNTTKVNVESLTSQVALLQSVVSMMNTDINAMQINITSLTSRATAFENSITTLITDMGTRINSRVNFYQNCYEDVANCTVIQHSLSTVWYLCHTPYRSVNITVSYNNMKLLFTAGP